MKICLLNETNHFSFIFSRGYAKHRNDYLLGDRLCKCVTHSDVNFWPRTWTVWVWVSCRPPKLRAAILVLVQYLKQSAVSRRGSRILKWGVKIHPFHLPWIRACSHSFKYFHKSEPQELKWPLFGSLHETHTQFLHVLGQKFTSEWVTHLHNLSPNK